MLDILIEHVRYITLAITDLRDSGKLCHMQNTASSWIQNTPEYLWRDIYLVHAEAQQGRKRRKKGAELRCPEMRKLGEHSSINMQGISRCSVTGIFKYDQVSENKFKSSS